MEVFPAKIMEIGQLLDGQKLSMERLSEVRDKTVSSTHVSTTAAADEGAPAVKRQRVETSANSVPCNTTLVEVRTLIDSLMDTVTAIIKGKTAVKMRI